MSESHFYVPSGKASLNALLSTFGLGMFAAVVGGVVYAAAIYYIPLVYFNILICLGFAWLIGSAVSLGGQAAHLRNPWAAILIGMLCGVVAEYVQWAAYLTLVYKNGEQIPVLFASWLTNPEDMWKTMMYISRRGLWTLKKTQINGNTLLAIWAIEAAIIALGSALFSPSKVRRPYSESCEKWMKEEILSPAVETIDKAALEQLKNGDISPLLRAGLPADTSAAFTKLTMFTCQGDSNAYLSIVQVNMTVKKGKQEASEKTQLTYLRLTLSQADSLRKHLSNLTTEFQAAEAFEATSAMEQPE